MLHAIPANPVPEGATADLLTAADGIKVRFARWSPTGPRRGTVCLFPGRAEMIEKYFEAIGELRERGFAVVALDWRGQGGSQRLVSDPRKGHVGNFREYQRDLEVLMREVVLPDCPPPFFALAHSMGAAILIETARLGRRWFDRMVLAAPMIELAPTQSPRAAGTVARFGKFIGLGRLYIPGGTPMSPSSRPFPGNPFTSDPIRHARAAALVEAAPELAIGSPTISWTYSALGLMRQLTDPFYPVALRQPMLLIGAGDDTIVSTPALARFASRLRAGAHLIIPASRHEILMERDAFRGQFWAAFDAFVPGSPLYR